MAIRIGTNNSTNYLFDLTIDPNYNYGLEDDRVVGLGGHDTIYAGAGNDHLEGGDGTNLYFDGDGNDTVLGGSGRDRVQVDAGNDIYYGEAGNDLLNFSIIHYGFKGTSKLAYQGIRLDLSLTSAQDLGEFGIDRFFGFEDVVGSFGDDTISGSAGANVIDGHNGNDTLSGLGGDDFLIGDNGNDHLSGGDGDDRLDGDSGNDILLGGAGADYLLGAWDADTLIGGLGSDIIEAGFGTVDLFRDVVRYESLKDSGTTAGTQDDIFWFTHGQDKIDLSKLDANLGLKGNQAFKVVKGFTKAFGEVKLVKSGANTIVQIDGDKDKAVDMTIYVFNAHLTKSDFIL
jgi:Ca2+-binding RTX toxin-like protein